MEDEKRNEPEIHIELTPPISADPTPEEIPVEEAPVKARRRKRDDPVVIGLMFAVSFLCLCIIGVMIYWLAAFLS